MLAPLRRSRLASVELVDPATRVPEVITCRLPHPPARQALFRPGTFFYRRYVEGFTLKGLRARCVGIGTPDHSKQARNTAKTKETNEVPDLVVASLRTRPYTYTSPCPQYDPLCGRTWPPACSFVEGICSFVRSFVGGVCSACSFIRRGRQPARRGRLLASPNGARLWPHTTAPAPASPFYRPCRARLSMHFVYSSTNSVYTVTTANSAERHSVKDCQHSALIPALEVLV